jgi:hypothetical protein
VIGTEFSEPVLVRVAELPERELRESLAALRRTEFIYESALYPVTEYAFKHPLTQEVALGSQLRERRARSHAGVARALEELHAGKLDAQAALLAQHWDEAGERERRFWSRAAQWVPGATRPVVRHWPRPRARQQARRGREAQRLRSKRSAIATMGGWRLGLARRRWRDREAGPRARAALDDRSVLIRIMIPEADAGREATRRATTRALAAGQ